MDWLTFVVLVGVGGLVCGLALGFLLFRSRKKERPVKSPKQNTHPTQPLRRDIDRQAVAERQRLRDVYNLIATLTSTLKYQRVLDMALDLSISAISTPGASTERLVSAVLLYTGT
jgi:hypothetical protein